MGGGPKGPPYPVCGKLFGRAGACPRRPEPGDGRWAAAPRGRPTRYVADYLVGRGLAPAAPNQEMDDGRRPQGAALPGMWQIIW